MAKKRKVFYDPLQDFESVLGSPNDKPFQPQNSSEWDDVLGMGEAQAWVQQEDEKKRQEEERKRAEDEKRRVDLIEKDKRGEVKQSFWGKVRDTFDANTEADEVRRAKEGRIGKDNRGISDRVKDKFDANTDVDKQKRIFKGKAELYQDEDGRGYQSIGGNIRDFFDADSGRDITKRQERGDPMLHEQFQKKRDEEIARARTATWNDEEKNARREIYAAKGINIDDPLNFDEKEVRKRMGIVTQDDKKKLLEQVEKVYQEADDVKMGRQGAVEQGARAFVKGVSDQVLDIPENVRTLASNLTDVVSPEGSRVDKWAQRQFDSSKTNVDKRRQEDQLLGAGTSESDNQLVSNLAGGAGSIAAAIGVTMITGGAGTIGKASKMAEAGKNFTTASKMWNVAKSTAGVKGVAPKMFAINTAGNVTRDVRGEGKDPLQALVTGVAAGWAEGKLEQFGLDKLVNPGTTNLAKQFATTTVSEGLQEFSQSASANAIATTYKDVDLTKALGEAIESGLYGMALGGIAGMPATFSKKLQEKGVSKEDADKAAADLGVSMDKGAETVAGVIRNQAEQESYQDLETLNADLDAQGVPRAEDLEPGQQQADPLEQANAELDAQGVPQIQAPPAQEVAQTPVESATPPTGTEAPVDPPYTDNFDQQSLDPLDQANATLDAEGVPQVGGQQAQDPIAEANAQLDSEGIPQVAEQTTQTMPVEQLTSYEGAPDEARVQEYEQEIREKGKVKPLKVAKDSKGNIGVEDGKHRLEALKRAGVKEVEVEDVTPPASFKKIYHGTDKVFDEFDVSKAADGSIWFTDNPSIIQRGEAGASGAGKIVERYIDENSLKLGDWDTQDRLTDEQMIQEGYDGLRLDSGEGEVTYRIFDPSKVSKAPPKKKGAVKPLSKKNATPPKAPQGFSYNEEGDLVNAKGEVAKIGEVQRAVQPRELTKMEDDINAGKGPKSLKVKTKAKVEGKQLREAKKEAKSVITAEAQANLDKARAGRNLYQEIKAVAPGISSSASLEDIPPMFKNKKGLPADEIADMLGFESERDLVTALQNYATDDTRKMTLKQAKEEAQKSLENGMSPYSEEYKNLTSRIGELTLEEERLGGALKENKPTPKAEVKKTLTKATKETPRELQTPPPRTKFESQEKKSKLATRLNTKAIERGLVDEGLVDQTTYETKNMKDQVDKAVELLETDEQMAREVALGITNPPGDLLQSIVYKVVSESALKSGDVDLLMQLGNSATARQMSERGQELRGLREMSSSDPARIISDIARMREKTLEKKMPKQYKGKTPRQAVKAIAQDIEAEVKSVKRMDWNTFMDSIMCK